MKFKIGDKVKIICIDTITGTRSVHAKIGQAGIVNKLTGIIHMPYTVYFASDKCMLNFMEKEIKKDIEVGEQLVFSFMKE